ncbi:MAG: alpha/beta fold hydrolase [Burkholderiaceae bacterium]
MSGLSELYPRFATHHFNNGVATLHARTAGSGPPLVLLHGYPQTHVCWHRVAPRLAETHTVVAMDLRGYGASSAPDGGGLADPKHEVYSKRTMARDVIAVMAALGHDRFAVMGHDRGARVAYRLALDSPEVITRLVLLDILPTIEQWDNMRWQSALRAYHWAFLAHRSASRDADRRLPPPTTSSTRWQAGPRRHAQHSIRQLLPTTTRCLPLPPRPHRLGTQGRRDLRPRSRRRRPGSRQAYHRTGLTAMGLGLSRQERPQPARCMAALVHRSARRRDRLGPLPRRGGPDAVLAAVRRS